MLTNDKMTTFYPYLYASITKYYSQLNKLGPQHLPKCCSVQKINPCCQVLPFAGHMQRAGAAGHVALQLLSGAMAQGAQWVPWKFGIFTISFTEIWLDCECSNLLEIAEQLRNFDEFWVFFGSLFFPSPVIKQPPESHGLIGDFFAPIWDHVDGIQKEIWIDCNQPHCDVKKQKKHMELDQGIITYHNQMCLLDLIGVCMIVIDPENWFLV